MSDFLKKWASFIGVPLIAFFLYLCCALGLSYLLTPYGVSNVMTTSISNLLFIMIGSVVYLRIYLRKYASPKMCYKDFSGFGWVVILVSFVIMYILTQAAGHVITANFEDAYMSEYTDMPEQELMLYVIMSVTLAPLAEELLFRGFMYQWMRRYVGIPFSFIVSTVFFTAIHGTFGHIPVTVGLSLFLCILLEMTGKLRYTIGFHILYNVFGLTYIVPLHITVSTAMIMFGIMIVVFVIALAVSPLLEKLFRKDAFPSLESVIDRKRKEYVMQIDDEHSVDTDNASASDDDVITLR